jgi:hypothetical protein
VAIGDCQQAGHLLHLLAQFRAQAESSDLLDFDEALALGRRERVVQSSDLLAEPHPSWILGVAFEQLRVHRDSQNSRQAAAGCIYRRDQLVDRPFLGSVVCECSAVENVVLPACGQLRSLARQGGEEERFFSGWVLSEHHASPMKAQEFPTQLTDEVQACLSP